MIGHLASPQGCYSAYEASFENYSNRSNSRFNGHKLTTLSSRTPEWERHWCADDHRLLARPTAFRHSFSSDHLSNPASRCWFDFVSVFECRSGRWKSIDDLSTVVRQSCSPEDHNRRPICPAKRRGRLHILHIWSPAKLLVCSGSI